MLVRFVNAVRFVCWCGWLGGAKAALLAHNLFTGVLESFKIFGWQGNKPNLKVQLGGQQARYDMRYDNRYGREKKTSCIFFIKKSIICSFLKEEIISIILSSTAQVFL